MYWASIKGRFQGINKQSSGAQRRIYLAMKYGSIWINNVKLIKTKGKSSKLTINHHLSTNITQDIVKIRNKLGLNSIEDRLMEIQKILKEFKDKK